jgi:type IV fimbrial biogenesis protein FimT
MPRRFRHQRGLTLIELMVAMAILVIVLSIGLPSFDGIANSSRLSSTTNELSGALQLARAESVRRNRNVVLCRSDDMATCASGAVWRGWIVFVDANGDDQANGGEEVVRTGTLPASPEIRASAAISSRSDRVTFLSTGIARADDVRALLNATLAVCVASTRPPENTREINIAFGSRTTVRAKSTGGACSQPADS